MFGTAPRRYVRTAVAAAAVSLLAALLLGQWWPVLAGVMVLAGLWWIFRAPWRSVPSSPLAIVGPVDGIVEAVESGRDPYLERDAFRICIVQGYLDAHCLRSPTEGTIRRRWFPHELDGPGGHGGRTAVWIQTDESDDVVVSIRPEARWPPVRCGGQAGERVGQGQVCGFAGVKARVDVYVPLNVRIDVAVDQPVRAGERTIATLVHD